MGSVRQGLFGWAILTAVALGAWSGVGSGAPSEPARSATTRPDRDDQIITRYRDALAKYPSADNHAALAWVLSRYKSANAEALQHAALALKLDPDHFKAHELAAIVLQMQDRHGQALSHLLALMAHDRPETQYYIGRVGALRLSVPERRTAIGALKRFVAQSDRHVHRAAARWLLAGLLLGEGQLDQARATYDDLGLIKAWRVIGPFDNEANAGFGMAYGPEKEIDLAKRYPGRGARVSWRKLAHVTPAGLCNLAAVMYPNDQVLAYAVTFVQVPARTEAVVRLGAEQSVGLWVNDRPVLRDDQDKGFALDQHVAPVVLEAGWNKVLVKVCRRGGRWRFGLRLTDPSGRSLDKLVASSDPHPTPDASTSKAPTFKYAPGMLAHFSRQVAEDRRNESSVYYLGLAQSAVHRRAPATQTLEWLVSLNGHCSEYRLRLALAYWADEKPDKAFEQLKETVLLEPKNLAAMSLLGRFYRSRDSLEKAHQTTKAALAAEPDSIAARLGLQEVYTARGWTHQAYVVAKRLHERHPEIPSLTANFAGFCEGYGYREQARRVWTQAVAQDAANVAAHRALANLDAREDHVDEALKRLEVLQRLDPLNHTIRTQRVQLLLRRQRYEPAIALCREALAICPTHAGFHAELGKIYERMGRMVDAIGSWRAALRYKPDDQRLRDYVEFLQPELKNPVFAEFEVGPEAEAEIIKNTRADQATYPKADAVILLEHQVTQLFEDGSSSSQEHGIYKVLNERGRRRYTKVPLSGQNRKVLRAVVIKPDGSEVEATRVSGNAIHFAQLQPGSIVAYKVVYHRSGTSWLSRHFTHVANFQSSDPIVRRDWILVAPKDRKVRYTLRGEHVKLTRGEFQGQAVYEFRARDVPMLETESVRPPLADIMEQVRLSTIEEWDEIARWEWALIKDQLEPDTAIRQKVKALTAGSRTREDRMRAIYNFVAQEIQYKVMHTSAIFGIKPDKAANVLANEWGECKGKAVLLMAMLREAGIEACYATLRTRSAGKLVRELPANQCNHAIVYVPDVDDFDHGRWLDATAQYHGMDALPWENRGVTALVFKPDGQMVFKPIPQIRPDQNVMRLALEVTLSADGSSQVRSHWNATGQFAGIFRKHYRQTGRRRQQLEAAIATLQPDGKLTDMAFSDLTDCDGPVEIRFDFKSYRYADRAGARLVLRPKRRFELTSRYAPRTERHYDIWLPMPSTIEYAEIYRFDPSWKVVSVPEPVRLDTPWTQYEIRYTSEPGRLRVDKKLVVQVADVPRAEYEQYRRFCIAADEHEQKTITVEPK